LILYFVLKFSFHHGHLLLQQLNPHFSFVKVLFFLLDALLLGLQLVFLSDDLFLLALHVLQISLQSPLTKTHAYMR